MEKGLTTKEAQKRLQEFGRNEIRVKKGTSPLAIFLSQFPTFINTILAVAGVFSFFVQDIIDSFFIFVVIFLNGIVGFLQEYRAEKSLEKLREFVKPESRIIRNGKEYVIPSSGLVPDDIVVLSEGDRIPADGVFVTRGFLEIDESILTGESIPVAKKENDEALSGTLVTKGRSFMKVQKTGIKTRFGQIAASLASIENEATPLQKQLTSLGKLISLGALLIALSIVPIGLLQGRLLFPIVLLAISIGVAAIPEGLPAVITIALALGTNRMAKQNAIVRKMPAVETLGAMQVVLVDKTGTLTKNQMKVKTFWTPTNDAKKQLLYACVLGNTASLIQKEGDHAFDIVGDKTDGALLEWANEQEKDIQKIKDEGTITDEFVFDPEQKTVTTVFLKGKTTHVYVRGAPETILANSTLSNTEKEKITKRFEDYAKEGLRVIGFGTKIEKHNTNKSRTQLENDLAFLGLIGIYDPPRPQVKQAIAHAKKAGIKTVMVTGDNELTALTIAKEIGLVEKDEDVLNGEALSKLRDQELLTIIEKTNIFARSGPENKLRLVTLFKQLGYVVGVTGDGVNDALALKKADVGVAMGETGTDVAKEAADVVLTDDNFSTLVKAIEEGRIIYSNIVKAITYLLMGNIAELLLVFFATVFAMPSPLLPTQILWINLVTDAFPALALASDTKNEDLITDNPRNPKAPFLSKKRTLFIVFVGLLIALLLLVVFKLTLSINGSETFARTITFNLLVMVEMILAFLVRGKSLFKKNTFLLVTVLAVAALQIAITTIPFFQEIFHLGF